MTCEVAAELAGIAQFDLAMRRQALTGYLQRNGSQRLVELLVQFIGMANAAAENCSEMSDQVLIEEWACIPTSSPA